MNFLKETFDGLVKEITDHGKNKPFSSGNEITLIIDGCYYRLYCDSELWNEVNKKMKELFKK